MHNTKTPTKTTRLEQLRQTRGWSRTELGQLCRPILNARTIAALERGQTERSHGRHERLQRIARAFGLPRLEDADTLLDPPLLQEPTKTTRLALLRQNRGWSRAELGRLASLDASMISALERGSRRPPPGSVTLRRLARALGLRDVDADTLLEPPTAETLRSIELALGLTT